MCGRETRTKDGSEWMKGEGGGGGEGFNFVRLFFCRLKLLFLFSLNTYCPFLVLHENLRIPFQEERQP